MLKITSWWCYQKPHGETCISHTVPHVCLSVIRWHSHPQLCFLDVNTIRTPLHYTLQYPQWRIRTFFAQKMDVVIYISNKSFQVNIFVKSLSIVKWGTGPVVLPEREAEVTQHTRSSTHFCVKRHTGYSCDLLNPTQVTLFGSLGSEVHKHTCNYHQSP